MARDDVPLATPAPHSPQNRSPGSFVAPHAEQTGASAAPQARQNFLDAAFSAPQDGQRTASPLDGSV